MELELNNVKGAKGTPAENKRFNVTFRCACVWTPGVHAATPTGRLLVGINHHWLFYQEGTA